MNTVSRKQKSGHPTRAKPAPAPPRAFASLAIFCFKIRFARLPVALKKICRPAPFPDRDDHAQI
jgi:hypothetical protein